MRAREKSDAEAAIIVAHATAQFVRAKKLERVEQYLPRKRAAQTPREMLAVFEQLKARGAALTIRRIAREG